MKHMCYIVKCSDDTLYCGYTNDLKKRIKTHNSGKGAKYTKTRLPVSLMFSKEFDSKSAAMKFEYKVKQMSRDQKLKLILNFYGSNYDKLQFVK